MRYIGYKETDTGRRCMYVTDNKYRGDGSRAGRSLRMPHRDPHGFALRSMSTRRYRMANS